MNDPKFTLTGDVKFGQPLSEEESQKVISALQDLMNEYRLVRIDLSLNPYVQGDIKVQPQGPNINLN